MGARAAGRPDAGRVRHTRPPAACAPRRCCATFSFVPFGALLSLVFVAGGLVLFILYGLDAANDSMDLLGYVQTTGEGRAASDRRAAGSAAGSPPAVLPRLGGGLTGAPTDRGRRVRQPDERLQDELAGDGGPGGRLRGVPRGGGQRAARAAAAQGRQVPHRQW